MANGAKLVAESEKIGGKTLGKKVMLIRKEKYDRLVEQSVIF